MMTDQKKHIDWIDTAKGICISLVVLNHVILYCGLKELVPAVCYNFLSAFRMPLYFFLSGLFFKTYGGFTMFVRKKTSKLLIPFTFFFGVFSVAIPWFIYAGGGHLPFIEGTPTGRQLMLDFLDNSQLVNGPLWFLLCLFEINLLFYALRKVFSRENLIYISATMCGVVGLLMSYYEIRFPASLDTAFTCMPFFCFGYYVRNHTQILSHSKVDNHLLQLSALCALVCFLLARHVQYVANFFYNTSYFTAHLCGIIGTMMVIMLSKKIGRLPLISYFGRYSIIILCSHVLVLKTLATFLPNNNPYVAVILFIIIMTSQLAIIPFCRKYLPYVTAQKEIF